YENVKERHDLPPVYRFPEPAARAASLLCRYAAWRRQPADAAPAVFAVDDTAVSALLGRPGADGYLEPADAFRVLEHYGIPVVPWRFAATPPEAVEAARALGFPVALKAIASGLV